MKIGLFWVLGVLALGCGGSTEIGGDGGVAAAGGSSGMAGNGTGGASASGGNGSGGSSGNAGTGASGSGGTGGTSASGCPSTEPSGGGSCTSPNLRCTYGDSIRPECRHEWLCLGGTWVTTRAFCADPPPGFCPVSSPPTGVVCSNDGAACGYDDGTICTCSSCEGLCSPPPPRWHCTPPPTAPGCPTFTPNDGTACDVPGVECQYGNVCSASGAWVKCEGGAWKWQTAIACPA